MKAYEVHGTGERRLLVVYGNHIQRKKFYQVVDDEKKDIKFIPAGNKYLAVVSDTVLVYDKPSLNSIHKEAMKHNARAQWLGVMPQFDRLVDDMLEYSEAI